MGLLWVQIHGKKAVGPMKRLVRRRRAAYLPAPGVGVVIKDLDSQTNIRFTNQGSLNDTPKAAPTNLFALGYKRILGADETL